MSKKSGFNNAKYSDDHFRGFTHSLERAIGKYEHLKGDAWTAKQKEQVEALVGYETAFRETLLAHPDCDKAYHEFIRHIKEEKRNILSAHPYFRERAERFSNELAEAIRNDRPSALYPFHFNYLFVKLILARQDWSGTELPALAAKMRKMRNELVILNMPLAINRTRIFWNRTQRSHMEFMDFVQIAAQGLLAAIDKFCLPYTTVFRSVAIGRMVGNFIENYSETMLHFFPADKRKIYRANKALNRMDRSHIDWDKLVGTINHEAEPAFITDKDEIASLLSALSILSATSKKDEEDSNNDGSVYETSMDVESEYSALESEYRRPDDSYEEVERHQIAKEAISKLDLVDQKFLKLKSMEF
ncbi:SigBFG, RNA polymerase sigma-70 factor, sigma-B/F/G subfamily [uncultured Caudovirales phage]|uniref:SigBFG, RNA polymerase sigma-70 factor, sigma-B/F/G subfamily n=1 Tax=uncultured Caudovirales phage TaxID=2100421 RepID=A0A6J5L5T1_9CAUD|nr:SigBFG, RNA polymerase sigma-70 factor, sigma-B/F/G subfamily [uncultured Caudovirales phage]